MPSPHYSSAEIKPRSLLATIVAALGLGAFAVLFVLVMLTPAMDGMISLPEHLLKKTHEDRSVKRVKPAPPPLTNAQKLAARRTVTRLVKKEIGVKEWPNRPNHSARIVTYRRAVTGPGEDPYADEPWCADFVSWAWKKAGHPIGFNGHGTDYVPELVAWAKLNRKWRPVRKGYRPQPGDLVVYTANGMRYGHTGVVVNHKNGRIITVEGNYNDRVSRRTMMRWDASIRGYVRPV